MPRLFADRVISTGV